MPLTELIQNDHDILVRLHENIELNFRQVKADIKDLKDGTSNQLTDHEKRIQFIERYKGTIQTTFTLYGVAIGASFTVLLYLIFRN